MWCQFSLHVDVVDNGYLPNSTKRNARRIAPAEAIANFRTVQGDFGREGLGEKDEETGLRLKECGMKTSAEGPALKDQNPVQLVRKRECGVVTGQRKGQGKDRRKSLLVDERDHTETFKSSTQPDLALEKSLISRLVTTQYIHPIRSAKTDTATA
jgi:hypothetical protein